MSRGWQGGCVLLVLDHVEGIGDDRHVLEAGVCAAQLLRLTQLLLQHRLHHMTQHTVSGAHMTQHTVSGAHVTVINICSEYTVMQIHSEQHKCNTVFLCLFNFF